MRELVDTPIDTKATLATLYRGGEYATVRGHGMLKSDWDMRRYDRLIIDTKPDVVVETGTRTGSSALWFSELVPLVITIDVDPRHRLRSLVKMSSGKIMPIVGDSTDPEIVSRVKEAVEGRNVLLSLDSAHDYQHVKREILAYGGLVQPGGYMVVEDGLFDYADHAEWQRFSFGNPELGNPMDAIKECLFNNEHWERALDIEGMFPISHHPVGWWRRTK